MVQDKNITPIEHIVNRIFLIRNIKVMFDFDLAELYGVTVKRLNEQVKRNKERFPEDFMFQLSHQEFKIWESQVLKFQNGTLNDEHGQHLNSQNVMTKPLRSQIATLKKGRGQHRKYLPYVFTEQGVAMLSSVLKSKRAVQTNIAIIRTFVKLREILLTHKELRLKIEKMEKKYDQQFKIIFETIKRFLISKEKPAGQLGFYADKK